MNKQKKLSLRRETIRSLTQHELGAALGGAIKTKTETEFCGPVTTDPGGGGTTYTLGCTDVCYPWPQ